MGYWRRLGDAFNAFFDREDEINDAIFHCVHQDQGCCDDPGCQAEVDAMRSW